MQHGHRLRVPKEFLRPLDPHLWSCLRTCRLVPRRRGKSLTGDSRGGVLQNGNQSREEDVVACECKKVAESAWCRTAPQGVDRQTSRQTRGGNHPGSEFLQMFTNTAGWKHVEHQDAGRRPNVFGFLSFMLVSFVFLFFGFSIFWVFQFFGFSIFWFFDFVCFLVFRFIFSFSSF